VPKEVRLKEAPGKMVESLHGSKGRRMNSNKSNRGGTGRKSDWREASTMCHSIIIRLAPDTMQNKDCYEMTMPTAVHSPLEQGVRENPSDGPLTSFLEKAILVRRHIRVISKSE